VSELPSASLHFGVGGIRTESCTRQQMVESSEQQATRQSSRATIECSQTQRRTSKSPKEVLHPPPVGSAARSISLTYSVVLRTELDFRKRDPELLTRRRRADDFNDFGLVPALSLSTSSFASKARHLLILTSDREAEYYELACY
jgi:hypothetical protein